jgi:hypothetical protein
MTLTFMNLVVVSGILVGLLTGSFEQFRQYYSGDVIITPAAKRDYIQGSQELIKGAVNILFVSLSVGVAYGIALYFINSDNEQKREQIKGYLLWAVIGLAVTFGLWGIIQIFCDTLSWCTAGIPLIRPPA